MNFSFFSSDVKKESSTKRAQLRVQKTEVKPERPSERAQARAKDGELKRESSKKSTREDLRESLKESAQINIKRKSIVKFLIFPLPRCWVVCLLNQITLHSFTNCMFRLVRTHS